jgi:two-component system, chemotaxis family, CheB/CheR fusion protein
MTQEKSLVMTHPPHFWRAHNVHSLRVLVVEDNPDCGESLAMLVRLYGHQVQVVLDGDAALQTVQTFQPDVVLLDIGLPKMDGYELARRLRSLVLAKRPFLVAVTGFGQDADLTRSEEAGIDMHFVKPVEPARLQQVLNRLHRLMQDC